MRMLGLAYYHGEGVKQDYAQAVSWYRRAIAAGDTWSQYLLGLCFRDGEGVKTSVTIAKQWFAKAAKHHPKARAALRQLSKT
jgi:uncharacterized protein